MPKFSLDIKTNVILVTGAFKGPKGIRMATMVLDTGASLTSISYQTALGIGVDPTRSSKRIEILTASGREIVSIVTIPEFSFLGFSLRGVEAICINLPENSRASALLGLNVLREFDISLLFRSRILEITR